LVYGQDGFAGEVGHVIMVPGGRPCGCGRKGCLERYCSATGIVITCLSNSKKLKAKSNSIDAKYIYELA
jgi:glucokinase